MQFVRRCYGLRGIYGRFYSKIRFEIESDGRFDSRFDSNAKNDSQVPIILVTVLRDAEDATRVWSRVPRTTVPPRRNVSTTPVLFRFTRCRHPLTTATRLRSAMSVISWNSLPSRMSEASSTAPSGTAQVHR